jgi:SNF2 family DNA or RNA helicase
MIIIDGSTTMKKRASLIEQFQQHGGTIRVCMVSSRAGNAGLNLTAANHLILSEPGLNKVVELQAAGQIHRIGQTRPVTVHKVYTAGTIEEQIYRLSVDGQLAGQGGMDTVAQATALLT